MRAGASSIAIIRAGGSCGTRRNTAACSSSAACCRRSASGSQRISARPGLPREKVLAAIVRLLETTLARVGNEEYAKSNKSFGLTTLRNRHVKVAGTPSHLRLPRQARHQASHRPAGPAARADHRALPGTPGQELFHYLDEDDEPRGVDSDDVNEYLREISGEDITAKDFRTWAATNLAALALRELEAFDTQAKAKKNVVQAVEAVSKMLGNTPAICRKCYIHPAIFEGYLDGSLVEGLKLRADETLAHPEGGLTAEEIAVTAFLSQRLGEAIAEQRGALRVPAPFALRSAHSNQTLRHDAAAREDNFHVLTRRWSGPPRAPSTCHR